MDNDDNGFTKAASLACAQVFPAILNAAIEMNLFEIISSSSLGMSASEIASKLPNQHSDLSKRLERMLPLLAVHSLLTCSIRTNQNGDTERLYSLSPVGIHFTPHHQHGTSFPSLFSTLIYQRFRHLWKDIKDAIMDGSNENHFEKVYGKNAYEYMGTEDRELGKLFGQAMYEAGSLGMKSILNAYKGFEGISTLVDVGGGIGQALIQILLQYPSIKGINFDLPHVVKNAPPHPGIEHMGGDMFKSVPKGDAILLKVSMVATY
ncbi:hypothetical protein PIB30_003540 [Stylosanthes scabra]|uniref:Uncharacterized protein n=1 Tax=Stylosanthes scabra TaxID=79078 RepID=A0ABU6W4P7_9FABA|nr:hypothetical protein [Stylosanthes scabra]